jgi:HK97 family phage major capsid protein
MSTNPVLEKIEEFGDAVLDLRKTADKQYDELKGRIEELESVGGRPRGTAVDDAGTADEREHKSKFLDWVRRPRDHQAKRILGEAQSEIEKKAVTIGSDPGGGFAVPTLIAANIERRVTAQNPFRQLVEVVTVGSSDFKKLVSKNQAGSGWVGEAGARSETATSDLVAAAPTFGTIYAYPKASEEAMGDVFFNIQAWLEQEAADGFTAAEALAIWSGDGSNKPSGLKKTTPTNVDDYASPERADTALEYVATGSSPITTAPNGDDLIELMYTVKTAYLSGPGVGWVMNRGTARGIRQLKDEQGQYLWERNVQAGQPEMLLGFPVYLTDVVDSVGANTFPVAFGNFRRAYILADHAASGLRVTVDDNITTPGYVKFYIRKRVGGIVTNNQAVKLLKCAAS